MHPKEKGIFCRAGRGMRGSLYFLYPYLYFFIFSFLYLYLFYFSWYVWYTVVYRGIRR